METVPQIISTKDLAYISDMFDWDYNAFKQIHHYTMEVEDESIKELLENLETMHYNHLQFLIAILKGEERDLEEVEYEEAETKIEMEEEIDEG